ncbi:acyltransferase [Blautia sp.]
MQKGMEIKKNKHFEHIRAFSVLAVITIHTMYSALLQFGEGASVVEKIMYRCVMNMMWWAVPCFLMMTGSLLLDSNRKVPLKKLYRKYILRMLLVLLIFGCAFSWMELFFDSRTLELGQILQVAYNVLTGNTWAHMWYLYCLLGLYVLLPMYKILADYASDAQLRYILVILFFFGSIFQLLKLWKINLGFYCHINTIYPFWLLMGAAWNRGMFKREKNFNVVLVMVSSGLLIFTSVLWEGFGVSLSSLFGYDSVLVVIQSIGLFSLFNSMNIESKLDQVLSEIGEKSFGIYLIHMVIINLAYKLFKFNPFAVGFVMGGIILVIVNLALSYIMVTIMKHLPGIKKII